MNVSDNSDEPLSPVSLPPTPKRLSRFTDAPKREESLGGGVVLLEGDDPSPQLSDRRGDSTPVHVIPEANLKKSKGKKRRTSAKGCRCPLINLFTTFIEDSKDLRKIAAQESTLRSYERLQPLGVQCWLFTESNKWAKMASNFQVRVVRRFEKSSYGQPILASMFKHVIKKTKAEAVGCNCKEQITFDAYANGDIIFTSGLVQTVRAVQQVWEPAVVAGYRRGIMIVGRRTNVDFYADNDLSSEAAVLSMAKRGELFQADAEDYFIYSRGSRDWDLMPRFVVGRRAYDNWLADNAFHDNNVDLLDATGSIVALHLTT